MRRSIISGGTECACRRRWRCSHLFEPRAIGMSSREFFFFDVSKNAGRYGVGSHHTRPHTRSIATCAKEMPSSTNISTHLNASAITELQEIRQTLCTVETDSPAVSPIRYEIQVQCGWWIDRISKECSRRSSQQTSERIVETAYRPPAATPRSS